jgi:aspartate/methionine/tyrosine aminotransferase
VFSHRLIWDHAENALAVLERQKRAASAPIVDLTESNPTRVGLLYPERAIAEALAHPAIHRYEPAPRGLPAAREAVARDGARSGRAVGPDRIVLTASSSESYGFLFKLLCDPGDAVLVPEPSYPLFDYLARLDAVRPVGYRLAYHGGWQLDAHSLEAAHARAAEGGGRVRAIVVVTPNNPTGSIADGVDLARLGEFCARHELAVVSDEVFASYRFAGGPDDDRAAPSLAAHPDVAERTLVFSLGGLSKSCGLPQLKLGWIAVGGPAGAVDGALARLELVADTYLSVATPVQLALPRLLELGADIRRAIRARVQGNRARLLAALPPGSPCSVLAADGGWNAIIRIPALPPPDATGDAAADGAWAAALLRDDDILVHPGYLYDMPPGAFLIVSLLPAPAPFATAIDRVIDRCGRSVT